MTQTYCSRTFVAGLAVVALFAGPAQTAGEADAVTALVAELQTGARSDVAGVRILATDFIGRVYEQRGGQPAWFGTGAETDLLAELRQALAQGFRAEDFHLPVLRDLYAAAEGGDPKAVATFDVLATEAAALLVHHMVFGKVDPTTLDPDFNFDRPVIGEDAADVFNSYLKGAGISALMDELAIDDPEYLQLVGALGEYLEIEALGGWPDIPEGTPLKPGVTDPRVPVLRERLTTTGDLPLALAKAAEARAAAEALEAATVPAQETASDETASEPDAMQADAPVGEDSPAQGDGDAEAAQATESVMLYDPDLAAAVERFQSRHGLTVDGVVGPRTLTALNRTPRQRADQLRLSLERFRWFVRELEDDYVLVNIGGPDLVLVLNREVAWRTRTITGSAYRQTPVFRDAIQYMEFNPTWTVPASIFRKDKLPRIRKDRGYLERNGYVVRNSAGKVVSASSVNWGAENPGVSLMQKPGPENALGRVKFMFPNKYAVYLHDTNDRSLFDREERNLSSGCVRVEDPYVFAGLLMRDDLDWTQEKMNAILDSGKTTRINLPEPMPVMLTYWTAWVQDGVVHFREDLYERDGPLLEALDAPL
jgi:murein L,D-transpeptidase YcbB/YkuD